MSHVYAIGNKMIEIIHEVLADVAQQTGRNDNVTRVSQQPYVSFRKRRSGAGREEAEMRINEGITVVPLKPERAIGTNERDGIGYKYMICIVSGTYRDLLDDASGEDWALATWEEAIRRRFHNKRMCPELDAASCELRTTVEPGQLPQWMKLQEGLDSTFLILTEYIRESRQ